MALAPGGVEITLDEKVLLDTVREYARSELIQLDRQWDLGGSNVMTELAQLSEMGFLSICVPESLGGLACSYRMYASIIHELSYAAPSVAVTVAVHNMVGSVLSKCAVEPLRSKWLKDFGQPDSLAAFAITEANAGSDASATRASARETADGFVVNGEKMWITNGLSARW